MLGARSASCPRPVDWFGAFRPRPGVGLHILTQRMIYEERVLSEVFPEYGDYVTRTARLLPGVY